MRAGALLLVEADPSERIRLGEIFEEAGYAVSVCPGPSGPDPVCVGERVGRCPLIEPADVIVLDLALRSEDVYSGTASEELLALYVSAGKPVVTLGSWHGLDAYAEADVHRIARHPDQRSVLAAVAAAREGKRYEPATRFSTWRGRRGCAGW